jgi:hypothetical protein
MENKGQHTPGPWEHRSGTILGAHETHPVKSGQGFVASIGFPARETGYSDLQLANARLIAAAPDLLAALEWALAQMEPSMDPDWQAAHAAALEALAKAKGGSR